MLHPPYYTRQQAESISYRSVSFIRFDPQMYERVLMFSEFAIGDFFF